MNAPAAPSPILFTDHNGIGELILNRPGKRNAMSGEMIARIEKIFAARDPDMRAYVIRAEGAHFSAGLDLSEHKARSVQEVMDLSALWHRATQLIVDSPVPVICALKGYVIGAGLELAAAAHVRIAEPDAVFSLPEGRRGIFVGGGASVRVGRLIGTSRLIEIMLSGREVAAEEAQRIGLFQLSAKDGEVTKDAHDYAIRVADNAPLSNRMILSGLSQIAEMPPQAGLFTESLAAALTQTSPEAKARMSAFFAGTKTENEPPQGGPRRRTDAD